MTEKANKGRLDWFAAILLYLAVIAYQGYQYGQGDQAQILPVLYALDHPGSYAHDHYVQAYLQSDINERTIFHALLRYLGYQNPVIVFFWHACISLLLILAWIRIASTFISEKIFQYLSVAGILIVGFHTSTGSNELYYNLLIPSLLAKTMASWAILYWLREKYFNWSILLLLATYMQPLVGIQCFLFTLMGSIAVIVIKKNGDPIPWKPILIYLVGALPWVYFLGKYNGGHDRPEVFMEIMEFRLSHHFFASYFGLFHLIFLCVLIFLCFISYKSKLRWAFIVIVAGCLIYETGVELMNSPVILYSQWWKTTIWLEAFGFVAACKWLEEKIKWRTVRLNPLWGIVVVLLLVVLYRFSGFISDKPILDNPLGHANSDAIDISEASLRLTPEKSLFIIPAELSAFRWYSKRDTYVDYKALFHQEIFLNEWYDRIQGVYNYSIEDKRKGISIYERGKELLSDPGPQTISAWKSLGITHFIGYPPRNTSLTLLAENDTYLLYQLP